MIFIQYGEIDVLDGAFVVIDKKGIRTQPLGSVACIMLEPGTRVSHAAVHLASTVGTLLVWVGEAGVRLYASGQRGRRHSLELLPSGDRHGRGRENARVARSNARGGRAQN